MSFGFEVRSAWREYDEIRPFARTSVPGETLRIEPKRLDAAVAGPTRGHRELHQPIHPRDDSSDGNPQHRARNVLGSPQVATRVRGSMAKKAAKGKKKR
jgi:hypothetical protein